MIGKYSILESTKLFKDNWFSVRKDKCLSPDGKIIDPYYVYEFPEWVCAFAMTADGKVIMEKHYRHALGEIGYELPGGVVDPGDRDFEAAIRRELLEETGYVFEKVELLGKTCANPSTNNNYIHLFIATGGQLIADQNLDENEFLEVELFALQDIITAWKNNEIVPYQAMHYVCVTLALKHLGKIG